MQKIEPLHNDYATTTQRRRGGVHVQEHTSVGAIKKLNDLKETGACCKPSPVYVARKSNKRSENEI